MLNLVLLTESLQRYEFVPDECEDGGSVGIFVRDPDSDRVYVLDGAGVQCYEQKRQVWSVEHPVPNGCLCAGHFFSEQASLFVAYLTGELFLLDAHGQTTFLLQTPGELKALEWSPDDELLLFATRDLLLYLVTTIDWEEIAVVNLRSCIECSERVRSVDMTWRGDGEFVAVYIEAGDQGEMMIFEATALKLHAVTEKAALEKIAWQPNGRHLYAAHFSAQDRTLQMWLFERNGMRHGQFDLRCSGQAREMVWSPDSQLLAVSIVEGHRWTLQIWRRSNWHWYLKYCRVWTIEGTTFCMAWDPEKALNLHIWWPEGCSVSHLDLQFSLQTLVSLNGTAAVVDGAALKLTPFRKLVIPPPLSAAHVVFGSPIQCAAFGMWQDREAIAVVCSDGDIGMVVCHEQDCWDRLDTAEDDGTEGVEWEPMKMENSEIRGLIAVGHIAFLGAPNLVLFGTDGCELATKAVTVSLDPVANGNNWKCSWRTENVLSHDFRVLRVLGSEATGDLLFVQSVDGHIYQNSPGTMEKTVERSDLSFPFPCPIVIVGNTSNGMQKLIGLSSTGQVYDGQKPVMETVTSIARHSDGENRDFLLMTTRDHRLLIRKFDDLLQTRQPTINRIRPVLGTL